MPAVAEVAGRLTAGQAHVGAWDVATGSGAVVVVLALALREHVQRGHVRLLATDVSPPAIELAAENLAAHDVAGLVSLECADLLELAGRCAAATGRRRRQPAVRNQRRGRRASRLARIRAARGARRWARWPRHPAPPVRRAAFAGRAQVRPCCSRSAGTRRTRSPALRPTARPWRSSRMSRGSIESSASRWQTEA